MIEPKRRSAKDTERARELRRNASRTEGRLWPHLRASQMGVAFRRQHPLAGFYLDYYCAQLKLGIEIDGPDHDPAKDANRDAALLANGVEVLRFAVQALDQNLQGVADTIHREVQMRLLSKATLKRPES